MPAKALFKLEVRDTVPGVVANSPNGLGEILGRLNDPLSDLSQHEGVLPFVNLAIAERIKRSKGLGSLRGYLVRTGQLRDAVVLECRNVNYDSQGAMALRVLGRLPSSEADAIGQSFLYFTSRNAVDESVPEQAKPRFGLNVEQVRAFGELASGQPFKTDAFDLADLGSLGYLGYQIPVFQPDEIAA